MSTLAIMMPEIPPAQAVRLNAGNVGRGLRDRYGEPLRPASSPAHLARAMPRRRDASYRLKLIVTVMITGTATPLRSVGLYSHWRTASSAA